MDSPEVEQPKVETGESKPVGKWWISLVAGVAGAFIGILIATLVIWASFTYDMHNLEERIAEGLVKGDNFAEIKTGRWQWRREVIINSSVTALILGVLVGIFGKLQRWGPNRSALFGFMISLFAYGICFFG